MDSLAGVSRVAGVGWWRPRFASVVPYSCINKIDSDETRTHNLLIRSQTPYPLGHRAENTTGRESDRIYTRVSVTVGGLGLSQSTAVSITCIIMTSWVCSKCPVARVHKADTRALTS